MEIWRECLLGDIVTFSNGKKRLKQMGNIPVYGGNGILDYISQSNYENCVIVGRVGAYCGSVFYEKNKCWVSDNAIAVLPKNNNDIRFIYYLLKTLHLNKRHIGTGQPLLTQGILNGIESYIPDINTQHYIASVLSAYDELIENNQKQISLLEELVQRLYKEWFIDFHFPNYENTPVIDGVPNGWKRERLVDIANVIMGQSPKSKFYNKNKEGLPFHQGVGSYGTRFVLDEIYSTSFTRIAEAGSILFSVRAPVGRLNITKNKIVIGRGLSAINHKNGYQSYLFYLLKKRFFRDNLIGNGSIFASISKDELLEQKFIIPDTKLVKKFDDIAKSIDDKINILDSQIIIAQEIRDRLLPKLMNGEINVSEFKFERNFI